MNKFLIYYNDTLKKLSRKKNNSLLDYLKFLAYFIIYYTEKNAVFLVGVFIVLSFFPGNIFNNFNTFIVTGLSAYLLHRLAHEVPYYGKISGHDYHHEDTKDFYKRAMEFFSDMFASGGFLLLINIILNLNCIYLFDNYAILLFMVGFPLIHFINYHWVIPKSYHHYHHKHPMTNFSPDFYDHLFGSNLGDYFEDNTHMLPIFILVGLIIVKLSKRKGFEKFMTSIHKSLKYNISKCKTNIPNMFNFNPSYK